MSIRDREATHHVDKMIRDFSRLVICRIRKSKHRSQFGTFTLKVRKDLLVAFICLDLAHLPSLQPLRDFVEVALLVSLEGVFKLGTQTALSTFSITISDGELFFLAFEDKRRERLQIFRGSLGRRCWIADLLVSSQSR